MKEIFKKGILMTKAILGLTVAVVLSNLSFATASNKLCDYTDVISAKIFEDHNTDQNDYLNYDELRPALRKFAPDVAKVAGIEKFKPRHQIDAATFYFRHGYFPLADNNAQLIHYLKWTISYRRHLSAYPADLKKFLDELYCK